MMATESERRIYVACLSSYNAGELHGRWIDATQGADHIREEVAAMLAESKHEPHEEWAIHDSEGLGKVGEYDDFDDIAALADALEEHGDAFLAYRDHVGDDATPERFQEAFRGEHRSVADYAEDFAREVYDLDKMGPMAQYIDFDKFGHDMEINGDIFSEDAPGGMVWIFDNNV
jgi:antirestriction protein